MNFSTISVIADGLSHYVMTIERESKMLPQSEDSKKALGIMDFILTKFEEIRVGCYLGDLMQTKEFNEEYFPATETYAQTDKMSFITSAVFESIIAIRNGVIALRKINLEKCIKIQAINVPDIEHISVRDKVHHMNPIAFEDDALREKSYFRIDPYNSHVDDNWVKLDSTLYGLFSSARSFLTALVEQLQTL